MAENMSHKIFFGADSEKLTPEINAENVPEWLNKEEKGLRVAIVAPRIELKDGWTHGYVASLLSNFFVAIHDGGLEFTLNNNKEVLNKNTVLGYFSNQEVRSAAESTGELERLQLAEHCIEALAANEFTTEFISVDNLGDFEVLIKVSEGLPKKVCFIRNGMYITNTLCHFGKPLVRFPNTKDFIVIVRPKKIDDTSSEVIKRMENPEHSELTTSYIADEEEVKRLKNAMFELEAGVREIIKMHAKMEVTETRSIEELREFFPESGDDNESSDTSNELDPTSIITDPGDRRGYRFPGAQTGGGNKGGKGRRGGGKAKKKGKQGPGSNKGKNKPVSIQCHSVKTAGSFVWQIKFSSLPDTGFLELWPEEESRSGTDVKSIMVDSCSLQDASIASGGLNVRIPLTDSTPSSFSLTLSRDVSVIDMRPVVKEN